MMTKDGWSRADHLQYSLLDEVNGGGKVWYGCCGDTKSLVLCRCLTLPSKPCKRSFFLSLRTVDDMPGWNRRKDFFNQHQDSNAEKHSILSSCGQNYNGTRLSDELAFLIKNSSVNILPGHSGTIITPPRSFHPLWQLQSTYLPVHQS